MKKILSIATLAAALFWMPSPAQFLGPPTAYSRVTADTLSDTSLFVVQVPSYGGSNSVKMRSITMSQLSEAIGSDSTLIGALIHDSLTAATGKWEASRLDVDTLNAGVLVVDDTTSVYDSVVVDSALIAGYATANTPARFDANKKIVSGAYSGTGTTVVTNNTPTIDSATLTGVTTGDAATWIGLTTVGEAGIQLTQTAANPPAGRLFASSEYGSTLRGITSSAYDLSLLAANGAYILRVPVGTSDLDIAADADFHATIDVDGKATFTDTVVAAKVRASIFSLGVGGYFDIADVGETSYNGDRFLVNSDLVLTELIGGSPQLLARRTDGTVFDTTVTIPDLDSVAVSALIHDSLSDSTGTWAATKLSLTRAIADSNGAALSVSNGFTGGGNVAGVRSNPGFTGETPLLLAAFSGGVDNVDGDVDTAVAYYVAEIDSGAGGTLEYAFYSPRSYPSHLGGDLRVVGLTTAGSLGVQLTSTATNPPAGRLFYSTEYGATLRGNTGSLYDLSLLATNGAYVLRNPTGTVNAEFTGKVSTTDTMVAYKNRANRGQFTDSVNTPVVNIGDATPITLYESDANVLTVDASEYVEMTGNLVVTDRAGAGNRLAIWRADGSAGDTSIVLVTGLDSATVSALINDSLTGGTGRWEANKITSDSVYGTFGTIGRAIFYPDQPVSIAIIADSAGPASVGFYPNNGNTTAWEVRAIPSGDSLQFYSSLGDSDNFPLTLTTTQATFQGSITTAAPPTGTAAAWRFGVIVEDTCILDATTYAQVSIGGTFRKVALCQ